MNLYDIAIRRPVFTVMLMLALVVFGILGYVALPINLLPSIEFPMVTVITILPGASPEVMESDVTDVIEAAVNTIEGIDQLTSYSGQGVSQVTVMFTTERDIDIAAQDVRDKVSGAVGQLPLDAEPPIVQKFDVNSQPMLWMALAGLDARELSDYADQVVKPALQSVPGIGNVIVPGFREPMIRIWVDRDKLAAHRLAVSDVIMALGRENLELPGGFIEGPLTELAVRNLGLFETVEDFDQMIVSTVDGRPIRLSDVGFTQLGVGDERGMARYNLTPTLGLGVAPRSGANLVDVNRAAREKMDELAKDFPPGLFYDVAFDGAEYVEKSIENVQVDIVYGAVLAILVVFVFLRSWRSTFIVSLAIPTSLIATFGFMRLFGFSLNNLTTLALALSVGVVIDDAIVVLENIFRHQEEGEDPFTAALKGTKEIALAAMAATFSIAAVFIPVAYMKGMIGQFLFEFGISVAAAVLISLFVALTLTPMLSSRILKVKPKHGRLYDILENGFQRLETSYSRALDWVLRHKIITLVVSTVIVVASLGLTPFIGGEFAPGRGHVGVHDHRRGAGRHLARGDGPQDAGDGADRARTTRDPLGLRRPRYRGARSGQLGHHVHADVQTIAARGAAGRGRAASAARAGRDRGSAGVGHRVQLLQRRRRGRRKGPRLLDPRPKPRRARPDRQPGHGTAQRRARFCRSRHQPRSRAAAALCQRRSRARGRSRARRGDDLRDRLRPDRRPRGRLLHRPGQALRRADQGPPVAGARPRGHRPAAGSDPDRPDGAARLGGRDHATASVRSTSTAPTASAACS